MHVKLGSLAIGLALALMGNIGLGASAVQWQPDLQRAQVLAAHSNRLVLVHFWGQGCPPCEWMDREVFTRPDVAGAIDRGFVAVKLDKDQFPAIARQFGVVAVPTDVIITPQGQVLGSYVGKAPATEFVERLNQVAQRAYAPPSQGYASQTIAPSSQANAQRQEYPYGSQANYPMGGMPQQGVPFAQQGMPANQTAAAPAAPRYTDQYNLPQNASSAPPTGQPSMSRQMAPAQNLASDAPTSQQNMGPYAQNSYMHPGGQQTDMSFQQNRDATVAANPPLALDGFCPVSLERTMRMDPQPKWIPGDPRWGVRHEGRTYLFAGPEEQQAFFNNPDFYAPVLSGSDAVLLVDQGQQVPGVREFGARWRDRVYLFSSRDTFERFQANPEIYESGIARSQPATANYGQPYGGQVGALPNPPYGYR